MANTRRASKLPMADNLKDSDSLLLEQENFISAMVVDIKKRLHKEKVFCRLPQVYSVDKKEGTVTTRGEVYTTVENLLMVSYNELSHAQRDVFVSLMLFDKGQDTISFGSARIPQEGAMEFTLEDETVMQFEEDDSTAFNGVVVSPYGPIPGTESWSTT